MSRVLKRSLAVAALATGLIGATAGVASAGLVGTTPCGTNGHGTNVSVDGHNASACVY